MIKYTPVESNHKDCYKVEKNGNLILTGWGYAEYGNVERRNGSTSTFLVSR